MIPHTLARELVMLPDGQREVWGMHGGRIDAGSPDPVAPEEIDYSLGRQEAEATEAAGCSSRAQHLPNFPHPLPRPHPHPCPVRPAAAAAAPTCATAGSVRDGSRGWRAAGGVSWRLRVPGRGQLSTRRPRPWRALPLPGARGAHPGPLLALDSGAAPGPSPGAAPVPPRARRSAPPLPLCARARGLGTAQRSLPGSRAASRGAGCPRCLDSRAGRRRPRAGTVAPGPRGRESLFDPLESTVPKSGPVR